MADFETPPTAGASCFLNVPDCPPRGRGWLAGAARVAVLVLGAVTPVIGQTAATDSSLAQSRPIVLSPTVATEIGWDDNVFRVNKNANPIGDFTVTLRPALQVSVLVPALKVTGRSEVDFVYFKQVSDIRSVDTVNDGQVELILRRVRPYVGGSWANARHRRNFEIDLPVRRIDSSWVAGVDLQFSGKTSLGVMTRRSRENYTGETVYLDTDLSQYLDATTTIQGARVRYALTPLTTIGADVEWDRADFPLTPERNAEGFRVTSYVNFQPLALVSGSAQIGVRKRTFLDGKAPPFEGAVARLDLGYTLLARTRFDVSAQRDLSYSYRADERDYLQTGIQLSVTQRLANAWDVSGALGRFNLLYGLGAASTSQTSRAERVIFYRLGVGYHIERTRVGIDVSREARTSDFSADRGYEGMRITSSVGYGF